MPIRFQKWITRQDLRNNPEVYYVFGDNVMRKGLGGQAREMRGEPNAIGVVTKWNPTMNEDAFFIDRDYKKYGPMLSADVAHVKTLYNKGKTIVFPSDGLGTGLSMLPTKAPHCYWILYSIVQNLYPEGEIPWQKPIINPLGNNDLNTL